MRPGAGQRRHAVFQRRAPWRRAAMPLRGSRTFGSTCSAPSTPFEAARPFLEAGGEKTGDAAFVIISSRLGGAGGQRQLIRPDQGGADPHGQGPGAAIRWQENPRQRGVAGHRLFHRAASGTWSSRTCRALSGCAGAQPDRPHGDAAGNRQRGGVPGEPGLLLHDTGSNLVVDGAISNRVNF